MAMKFVLAITMLCFAGCSSGKKPSEQPKIPSCGEFYNFYDSFSKKIGVNTDFTLKVLEEAIEKHKCNVIIHCNEKDYCVGPML